MLEEVRREFDASRTPLVVCGCVGPRGDGYVPDRAMSADEAERYHGEQVEALAATPADMICALTINYVEEAIGIARAARRAGTPAVVSFTVETDGNLPTGQTLKTAVEEVDAHPTRFDRVIRQGGGWVQRIRGLRANASRMSHAELNEVPSLDVGDPAELGQEYAALKREARQLCVLGGYCRTDVRHVEQIAAACQPLFDAPA